MKRILPLLPLLALPAAAADWTLSADGTSLSYRGWVFNCGGTPDALHIASVASYPQIVTDIDFSTIAADTGATPVSTGNNLLASYPNAQGRYVGSVTLAPTFRRIGANFLVYSACTNLVIPAGTALSEIPASFLSSTAAAFDLSQIPDTVTNIADGAFSTDSKVFGALVVPAGCLAIGNSAFYGGNTGLPKVTGLSFAEGSVCERIGANAFCQSGIPGTVSLPPTIRSLGMQAFCYTKLTAVDIPAEAAIPSFPNGLFSESYIREAPRIPATVTNLGNSVFAGCGSLRGSVTIPASVRSLGNSVFDNCYALQEVVFEEGCRAIGSGVFASCGALTNVVFPRTLRTVGGGRLFGGSGHYQEWRAMKRGDVWWKRLPEFSDGGERLFMYGNASNGGRPGAVTNHLSFVQWAPYAASHPEFAIPADKRGAGTWTSPVAGETGSAVATIVNWSIDPAILILR